MAGTSLDNDEKPLDPAAERLRRRLVRFMLINLGILFLAFLIVAGAIFYKFSIAPQSADSNAALPSDIHNGAVAEGTITLPAQSRLVSQSFSGSQVMLDVEMPDKSRVLMLYDLAGKRILGRFHVISPDKPK